MAKRVIYPNPRIALVWFKTGVDGDGDDVYAPWDGGSNLVSRTASAPSNVSVGVASALAVAANASRRGLALTNTSVNIIYLWLGATAVLLKGIVLYPGGTYEMTDADFTTAAVNAIADGASSNLAAQEFT